MKIQSGLFPLSTIGSGKDSKNESLQFRVNFNQAFSTDDITIIAFVESLDGVFMPQIKIDHIDATGFTFRVQDLLDSVQDVLSPGFAQYFGEKVGYIAALKSCYPDYVS